jgi:hypothetical protein
MKDKFIHLEDFIKNDVFIKPTNYENKIFLIRFEHIGQYRKFHMSEYTSLKDQAKYKKLYLQVNLFLSNISNIKCIRLRDMHERTFTNGIEGFINSCKKHSIDYIITIYKDNFEYNKIKKLIINSKIKLVTIPLLINTNVFKDYTLNKKWDILFYGAISDAYPFRKRLIKILLSSRLKHLKIKILKYGELRKEKLAMEINKSWLTISTKSKFNYLVEKYFEIPASKSLVLGNMPQQGKNIFGINYIYVDNHMSDNEIINRIKNIFLNKKLITKKTNDAYKIIHNSYYSFDQQFYNILYNKLKIYF